MALVWSLPKLTVLFPETLTPALAVARPDHADVLLSPIIDSRVCYSGTRVVWIVHPNIVFLKPFILVLFPIMYEHTSI